MSTRARGGGRQLQFPVGRRRRYAPVVDAECGCRPRRPRLLSLPSFLRRPCSQLMDGVKAAATTTTTRRGGVGEQYSSCASTSTAASSAATRSTGGYASAYSSDYYYCYPSRVVYGAGAAAKAAPAPAAAGKKKKKKEKRGEKAEAEADGLGLGVAVEKESSDPRADFRDSMVQMVLEMGLCDWDGLRGMLRRLLALNAPRHHAAILTAFAEVCAQLAGAAAADAPPAHPSPPAPCQYRR